MNAAYRALHEAAAWLDLSARGRIYATGEDRARLLHAMTTHHVQQLQPGQGCYAFFLNAQGRILGDVHLFCLEDRFLLDVEPETREQLYQHLDRYIIADDVTLEDVTAALTAVAVEGPRAAGVLAALGAPAPEALFHTALWEGRRVSRLSFTGAPGWRIFAPAGEAQDLARKLEAAGAVSADAETARVVRIEHFRPRYGEDIFDTTLTAETQQTHAVHFNKGCYLGQEVVERVRSRGHVNRLLVGLEIDATEPPAPQTPVAAAGQEVGKTCSAAFSPARGRVVGMAYLRVTHAAPGTELEVSGARAVTVPVAGPGPSAGY